MTNYAKHNVRNLIWKNGMFSKITLDKIKKIIASKGFEIVEYKKYSNDEATEKIIKTLNLEEKVRTHDSFFFVNGNLKMIFINADIPDDDKLSLLCHELGHICDERLGLSKHIYSHIKQEEYANEFSHYLQHSGIKMKLAAVISAIMVLLSGTGYFVYNHFSQSKPASSSTGIPVSEELYVTPSGEKYHRSFCKHVRYRDDIRSLTLDEAYEQSYRPCLDCIGE